MFCMWLGLNLNLKQNVWNKKKKKSYKYLTSTTSYSQNKPFWDHTSSFFVPTLRNHGTSVMPPELKTSKIGIEYVRPLFALECSFCSLADLLIYIYTHSESCELILSLFQKSNIGDRHIPSNFLPGLVVYVTACESQLSCLNF